jgi:hypothetical protein
MHTHDAIVVERSRMEGREQGEKERGERGKGKWKKE